MARGIAKNRQEQLRKIGEKLRGHIVSKETRRKIGKANKKVFSNPELRKKMSEIQRGSNNSMYGKTPWNKGRAQSDRVKRKIGKWSKRYWRDAKLGLVKMPNRKCTNEQKIKISERLKGKKHTEEWKVRAREIQKKRWFKVHGGNPKTPILRIVRNSIEYKLWRKAVFEKDNFTCQKYGTRGGELVAHHINNFIEFSELRFAIDNGITLSKKAHKEFHKRYGFRNNTKEQLEEFLLN